MMTMNLNFDRMAPTLLTFKNLLRLLYLNLNNTCTCTGFYNNKFIKIQLKYNDVLTSFSLMLSLLQLCMQ